MFSFFRGKIQKKYNDKVIIEVSGIGFEVFMTEGDINRLNLEEETKINIYTDIKEVYIGLFGFLDEQALSVFEKLKKVSGIGSKTAISILSNMNQEELCIAIANEDSAVLSKIPGVGTKTAARIILELKDKVLKDSNVPLKRNSDNKNTSAPQNEAVLALKVLGYSASDINETLKNIDTTNLKVEEIIKKVLANINKR